MSPPLALVRPPAPSFVRALSSHPGRDAIDYDRALRQHQAYVEALQEAGAEVRVLPPLAAHPDSVFIEDNAIVLDGQVVMCPLGAPSRREEAAITRRWLEETLPDSDPPVRNLQFRTLPPPALLDGGDVVLTGTEVWVGLSTRTNRRAAAELAQLTPKPVRTVAVTRGLHLKSALSWLGSGRVLIDPGALQAEDFLQTYEWVEVQPQEAYAANALVLGETVLLPAGFERVAARLEGCGRRVLTLDMSEFEKADGGVTCLSLILPAA
ncbi:MAG: dimethylarginine dimethylaminohydrolase family protein [Nitrospinaceae bacterium]